MSRTIITHPQSHITTYPRTPDGSRRRTVLTSKQFMLSRLMSGEWVNANQFADRMGNYRARLAELRSEGYQIDRNEDGTRLRLTALPGMHRNSFPFQY